MEPRELVVLAGWVIVLIVLGALAVRDLRRQTGPTDVWSHLTYRPARRARRVRRDRESAIAAMIRDAYANGVPPDEIERALAAVHQRAGIRYPTDHI